MKILNHWCFSCIHDALGHGTKGPFLCVSCQCIDFLAKKYIAYRLLVCGTYELHNCMEESDILLTLLICQFPASHICDFCLFHFQHLHVYTALFLMTLKTSANANCGWRHGLFAQFSRMLSILKEGQRMLEVMIHTPYGFSSVFQTCSSIIYSLFLSLLVF